METRAASSPLMVNRRRALVGAGMLATGAGLGQLVGHTAAQDADMVHHPMVGIWLGMTPDGPSPAYFFPDGTFLGSSAPISANPDGTVSFLSQQNGTWEPDSANGIHFTSVQNVHDASGAFTGTVTVDGYPAASADGEAFYDDASRVRVTFRDATGATTAVLGEDGSLPPVYGYRMRPGSGDFPQPPAGAATPTT